MPINRKNWEVAWYSCRHKCAAGVPLRLYQGTESQREEKTGRNLVLKKLWPDSTEDKSCRSPRPLGTLLPTVHSCSAMPQPVAVPRPFGGCSNIYHSCGFLLLFSFPSFSCNILLFSMSLPGLEILPWLHFLCFSLPASDWPKLFGNRIIQCKNSAGMDFQKSSDITSCSKQGQVTVKLLKDIISN